MRVGMFALYSDNLSSNCNDKVCNSFWLLKCTVN